MEWVTLGDIKLHALGFGTWQLKGDVCYDAVDHVLSLGCRHIDTAQIYDNEEHVGDAIARSDVPRDEIFLTTKVWMRNFHHTKVLPSIEESLTKLQTDYVDLLLIHWPSSDPNTGATWAEALEQLSTALEQGKTRAIGVSNFTPEQWNSALQIAPVVCNQVEYHPFLSQKRLIEAVQSAKTPSLLTAYSPIAQGRVLDNDVLRRIGRKYRKSAVQVTLRWHIQQKNVSAIPRSSSVKNRKANFDIFDFKLTDDEMDAIYALNRDNRLISPEWAPTWAPRPE